jgi:DNA modification methylase
MTANIILSGNNINTLKTLPDNFVDCCITSPPYYGLRDYGAAQWEGGDSDCDHKIPSYEHDPKRVGTDNGSSHVSRYNREKCHKCGAVRIDQQIGLEETPEKYVEKLVDVFREVKRILRNDGTLWVNIGDSYNGYKGNAFSNTNGSKYAGFRDQPARESRYGLECKNLKAKDLIGIPWMLAFALRADGYYLRQDIIWHKPNPMPESVTDRCTKSHEYIFLLSKSVKYYYDNEIIKENCSKECVEDYMPADFKRNKRDVWIVNTKPNSYAHFATYPEELITPCILAGSREGGIVLDPFMGSGTTAVTAVKLLRKYIGCEINPEYIKIAEERIASERGLFN